MASDVRAQAGVAIRIALFGQPRVVSADGTRDFELQRKTLNVLAYLVLNAKRPPTRNAIAFALFPDEDEEKARASLRRNLSYLQSSLPEQKTDVPFVLADAVRVAWNLAAPARVDVLEFERAIAEGRDDDALAEYAGPLLPTLFDEWTTADRERFREMAHDALARTIARDRSQRRFDVATASARRLLEEDPWREDIVRELMSVRYEAGDRAGALAAFEQLATRLRTEMGAGPMPETTALREAVLRGARLSTSEPAVARRPAGSAGLPFVGREDAMARAIERWHSSADGRAGTLFIAGEAGIGKSRFAAELARAIEREGGVTIIGETAAGGERRPYESVIEALRYAQPSRTADGASRSDAWRTLVEQLLDEHAHATLSDDRSARARLFGAILKAVRELARTRPLAIVLEDLHWSGAATIELIAYLSERLATAPVVLVLTYRDDELPRTHPLRDLVRDSQRVGNATHIALHRLDATAAARALDPSQLSAERSGRAIAWSGGLPLLLAEAVRDLTAGRELIGADFRGVIGDRFERLSEEAETALMFAAVLGARFELESLAASTGWRDDEIVDALAPSIELGLIRAGTRGRGLSFAFSHHLVHALALERMPENDRIRIHSLVARALRSMYSGSDRAIEIAQHYAAAGDVRRAAEQYAAGARYALDIFANPDARDAATAGLAFMTPVSADAGLHYELATIYERALARIGAPVERRAAAELLCELAGSDELRLNAALGRLVEALRIDLPAQRVAFARWEELARSSRFAAGSFEVATATEASSDGDFVKAAAASERAADIFDALGDRDAALRARNQLIYALVMLGQPERAAEIVAVIRPQAEACEDVVLRMEFYSMACGTGLDGKREEAIADGEKALELALVSGDLQGEAHARQNLGWAAGYIGDLGRQISEWERAIRCWSDVGNPQTARVTIFNLSSALCLAGDYDAALRCIDELEAPPPGHPWMALQADVNRGWLWLQAGDFDRAEQHFLPARPMAEQSGMLPYVAHIQACIGEIAARRGDFASACVELAGAAERLRSLQLPVACAEALALLARVRIEMHDEPAGRAAIVAALSAIDGINRPEIGAKFWWDLTAASALLDDPAANGYAEFAMRKFSADALTLPADLAERHGRHPWYVAASAYLAGREVALTLVT